MPMRTVLSNVVLFQLGWLACVLGAAHGRPWTGVGVALAVVAWHLYRAPRRVPEVMLIALLVAAGVVFDSLLASSGIVIYRSPAPWAHLAPVWIVALWACFATTMNVSLRWIRNRTALAALFGAVGGPLAYAGGAGLGAVSLEQPGAAMLVLATGWALIMLVATALAKQFDGWANGPRPAPILAAGSA